MRVHLFEFGDQQWFPQTLRDAETAYLATAYRFLSQLPRAWAEKIATVLNPGESAEILDLCSGSGGAMPSIIQQLEKRGYDVRASLSDLYPNPKSISHPRIVWLADPVDATRVSPELRGVRTMFSAFHHFRPAAAKSILKDAFDHRRAICIFESGVSPPLGIVLAILLIPVNVLLLMPFARPFRWSYLAFTYLIPLMPFIILWDGIVSHLRLYSTKEINELTKDLQAPDYVWDAGFIHISGLPGGLPYLIGRPAPRQGSHSIE